MKYFIALLLSAKCLMAQTTRFDNAQISMFVNGSITIFVNTNQPPAPPVNFTNILLADGPNHLWMFNDASGQVTDYAGSANLTIPTGLTLGKTGLLVGSSMTAGATSNALISLGSASVNNFNTNQNWSYEFLGKWFNERVGSFQQHALVSHLNVSFSGYEIQVAYNPATGAPVSSDTADGTAMPSWMTIRTFLGSTASEFQDQYSTCDVSNNIATYIAVTCGWTNNTPIIKMYLNGNSIQQTVEAFTPTTFTTPMSNSTAGSLMSRPDGSTFCTNIIQCVASYTNILTDQQILTHYLAFQGTNYNPNATLYSSFKGNDTGGTPLRIANGFYLWVPSENRYYVYGLGTTGIDTNIGCGIDQIGVKKVTVYTTTNLTQGRFSQAGTGGIAYDATADPNIFEIVRPSVVYNTNSAKYVMWLRQVNTPVCGGTNTFFATVAESSTPGGPFSLVASNVMLNGNNPGDLSIYRDDDSTAYVVYAVYAATTILKATALTSDYHASTGSAINVVASGNMEAPFMFKRSGQYFVVGSIVEYYNAILCLDCYYCTATSPLGTYSAPATIFSGYNPLSTGLEGQTAGGAFQFASNTNRWFSTLDNWHNGKLSDSTVNYYELTFPTTSTISVVPSKFLQLP